ncbi:interleukin-27 subunit beta [Solea solea]|uniref:interleukin-27 subunit beta n=1 Tax=Solea solea TaxID=90069 RepID=UPI00272BAD38|nr:interleukin-27 subunit beta [Solea solea]
MLMTAMFGSVILLVCVLGGHALDLLRAAVTSANPPPAPTVHCWCASYPNTTLCSWPEPSHAPLTHYIATYSERHGEPITEQCHLIPPSSSSSSSSEQVWLCQMPNLKLLTSYIINVTAVSSAGSSSYLASFMLEDIVKPDPPVDVQVSPCNTRNLLVEWSPPSTWSHLNIFPLKYQIMYQWENKGTPQSVNLGPFESTKVELKGLTPGRSYLFQVCAKELLGLGKCSHWSSPVNVTIPQTKS